MEESTDETRHQKKTTTTEYITNKKTTAYKKNNNAKKKQKRKQLTQKPHYIKELMEDWSSVNTIRPTGVGVNEVNNVSLNKEAGEFWVKTNYNNIVRLASRHRFAKVVHAVFKSTRDRNQNHIKQNNNIQRENKI